MAQTAMFDVVMTAIVPSLHAADRPISSDERAELESRRIAESRADDSPPSGRYHVEQAQLERAMFGRSWMDGEGCDHDGE